VRQFGSITNRQVRELLGVDKFAASETLRKLTTAGKLKRVGLGDNTNRAVSVYELPLSFRFPPLREGNRVGAQVLPTSRGEPRQGSVPPARRGNLKEGGVNYAGYAYPLCSLARK
jgi:hypothetical protein